MGLTPIEDAGCRPMKRTNGVPPRGAIQDGFLTRRARCRCRSSGKLSQGGGCFPILQWGVSTAPVPISLPRRYLSVIARPALADPAEKGRTGATPPFLPLYRQTGRGGCTSRCTTVYPPFQGSLPSDLSLQEGSEHVPQAGADAPEASSMKMRYPILVSGGLCCSVWGFI